MLRLFLIGMLLVPIKSFTLPFNSNDAKALGMAGIGVASSGGFYAHQFNPALLTLNPNKNRFYFSLNNASAQAIFQFDTYRALLDLKNKNYGITLEQLIRTMNTQLAAALTADNSLDDSYNSNLQAFNSTSQAFIDRLTIVKKRFLSVDASPVQVNFSFNINQFGFSLFFTDQYFLHVLPTASDCDLTLLKGYQDILTSINTTDGILTEDKKNVQLRCQEETELISVFDPTAINNPLTNPFNTNLAKPLLYSKAIASYLHFQEVGLAVAHRLSLSNVLLSIGMTPKFTRVQAAQMHSTIIDISQNRADFSDLYNQTKTQMFFNMDIASAIDFNGDQSIVAGFIVKNIFNIAIAPAPTNDTETHYNFSLKPQVRLGLKWQYKRFLFASDIDLSSNNGLYDKSFDESYATGETQHIGLGAEFHWSRFFHLRAGLKYNMLNHADIGLSSGFSLLLNPLQFHLGLMYGYKSYGAGINLGIIF